MTAWPAQCDGVHQHQLRSQPDRGHMLADAAHDGVLCFEQLGMRMSS